MEMEITTKKCTCDWCKGWEDASEAIYADTDPVLRAAMGWDEAKTCYSIMNSRNTDLEHRLARAHMDRTERHLSDAIAASKRCRELKEKS
jgi:hypothetical protein